MHRALGSWGDCLETGTRQLRAPCYVQVSKAERVGAGVGWNLSDVSGIGFIEKLVLVGICRR